MKPASFEMFRPASLEEATRLLADNGDTARLIAGGQSLVPLLNFRLATPGILIDLNRVAGLTGIRREGASLHIKAMTRQQELIDDPLVSTHAPLLAEAGRHIGHIQTRSRGTVGGSLAQADPSAELPLAVVTLGANLRVQSVRGTRDVPARAFFRHAMVSDLAPDEILTEIVVPVARPSARYSFREFSRRHGDFAIVAAAIYLDPPDLAIGVTGLESVPRLCVHLTDVLRANGFSRAAVDSAIEGELAQASPNADLQASAEFRRHLTRVLLQDCLSEVLPS
jgi:2-furoyl-CoA dehydrogenase FAD binding subunit